MYGAVSRVAKASDKDVLLLGNDFEPFDKIRYPGPGHDDVLVNLVRLYPVERCRYGAPCLPEVLYLVLVPCRPEIRCSVIETYACDCLCLFLYSVDIAVDLYQKQRACLRQAHICVLFDAPERGAVHYLKGRRDDLGLNDGGSGPCSVLEVIEEREHCPCHFRKRKEL